LWRIAQTRFGGEREKEASSSLPLSHPRCRSGSKYKIDIENEETHAEKEDGCYANEGASRPKNEKRGKSRYVYAKIAVYRRRCEDEKKGVKQGKVVTVVERHNEITVNNNENDRNKNKDRQRITSSPIF